MLNFNDFTTLAAEIRLFLIAYSPIGVIGLWRWGVWLIKRVYAAAYYPAAGTYDAPVAVITPVYNENPEVFTRALTSWRDNGVKEIVAVIDYTDTACLKIFRTFAHDFPGARLIVTRVPGKRPALVRGIKAARSDIVALVDSDTIWSPNVRQQALIPFRDPAVGGVATRQSVLKPTTLAQRLFNLQLNMRYNEELPFMVADGGTVITCISGRTALYRRAAVLPLLKDLLNETFWGRPVISGDDKCLTYLVERAGWKVAFQRTAHVFTPGVASFRAFSKQRLRWTRNSWRADLKTLSQPWVWRHPRFAAYLLDRTLQPFAQLLAPIFLVVSLVLGAWVPAVILLAWWHVGRAVRIYSHVKHRPREFVLLPLLVALNFYFALIKVYALVTLNRQGWITRWDTSRLPLAPKWLTATVSYVFTAVIIGALAAGVAAQERRAMKLSTSAPAVAAFVPVVADIIPDQPVRHVARYVVQPGDSLARIAAASGVGLEELVNANAAFLPSRDHVESGLVLHIPSPGIHPTTSYVTTYGQLGPLNITYTATTNTIEVRGRGRQVTLTDIHAMVGDQHLAQRAPGEWLLSANVAIKAGVTLRVSGGEVTWLKLKSQPGEVVTVRADEGQLLLADTTITSWDPNINNYDVATTDGRSHLIAVAGRLDIVRSEIAYLGQPAQPAVSNPFGVAWVSSSGQVVDSHFHHNFHGVHFSEAAGVSVRGSELDHNERHGLNIAAGSIISAQRNQVHHNGVHGVQVVNAPRAEVRGNELYDNGGRAVHIVADE